MQGALESKGMIVKYRDCYLLRQMMPYPSATSNSYLVEVDNGWAVIDVGVNLPSTRQFWRQALNEIGIDWLQIQAIYITHCHPDHLGAAAWMQQMAEAPVYMLDQELERAKRYVFLSGDYMESYLHETYGEMIMQGFGRDKSLRLAMDWTQEVHPLYPEPELIRTLSVNQVIRLAGQFYEVIHLPGHTDGQSGFWARESGRLFSADLMTLDGGYLHFTDWPNTRNPNPLGDLFTTLELVKDLAAVELLPGHGSVITQPDKVIEPLQQRHIRILTRVLSRLQKPCSAAEMYQQLMKIADEEYIHYHRVSLGEALGYMRYLELRGEVSSFLEEGVLRFVSR